jgi:glycosyltransferase involved in cell wall biosynthesis
MDVPASLLVDATFAAPGLDDQITQLQTLVAGTAHELVVVRPGEASGRRAALRAAAARATHDACVAVGPLAVIDDPALPGALAAAVAAGAGLAAPVLDTPAGPVHGYTAGSDGRLLPIAPADAAAGTATAALALDVVAAPRALFTADAFPELGTGGPYETALARAAAPFGPLAVVADVRAARVAHGPAITVVVCTRNRAEELPDCVAALVAHGALAGGGEVVIVDSGSSDDTPAVAAALAAAHDGVRTVRDDAGGLSRARMAGAAIARNDVLAFIDDDARPAPGWIESLRGVFADPAVAVGGGPVHGLWPGEPAWRPPAGWEAYFSVLTHGDAGFSRELGDFYGTNWAVRRDVLDAIGGFSEQWGAGAHGSLPGEETAAEHAIARAGLGACGYAPGAAIGHRIDPARLDESWLLGRVFRHGLILPHAQAGFAPPQPEQLQAQAQASALALHAAGYATGELPAAAVLDAIGTALAPLPQRLEAARHLGVIVRAVHLLGAADCALGALRVTITADDAAGRLPGPVAVRAAAQPRPFTLVEGQPVPVLRVLAMVPVYNEADVIRPVVEDLIANGCDVYVLDNNSDDGTVEAIADLVGRGVIAIERFPDQAGYDPRNGHQFVLADQLRRLGEIAAERGEYDWYVVADGDEFRESPFPGTTFAQGLGIAHAAGYSAVNFELYDFRPVDDGFVPGTDVRAHITAWEPARRFDVGQVKAWANPGGPANLGDLHGAGAQFRGRRVFPVPFILRHYSLRGETHGRQKVFRDRMPRFAPEERASNWHVQYDALFDGTQKFLWDPAELREWDGDAVRAGLLARASQRLLLAALAQDVVLDGRAPSPAALAGFLGRTVLDAVPSDAVAEQALGQAGAATPPAEREVLGALALRTAQMWAVGSPVPASRGQEALRGLEPLAATPDAPQRFTALAFADELVADPELLRGYGAQFGAADPATLVIHMDGTVDTDALVAAVAAAGLDHDGGPDLLATDVVPAGLRAIYSRRTGDERLAALPRLGDAAALARLALAA